MSQKKETRLMKQGQVDHGSRRDVRLFRNNVGQAWQGRRLKYKPGDYHKVERGDVILSEARPVQFGLAEGSGDLIGGKVVTVTQDMVGKPLLVFLSIETKTEKGRLSTEQKNWIQFVQLFGGIAGVARTAEDFHSIIDGETNGK
jgi:hypothetical protein